MIIYLFKSFLISFILLAIYILFLRRNQSFVFNRFYLLLTIVAIIGVPNIYQTVSIAEEGNTILFQSTKLIEQLESTPKLLTQNTSTPKKTNFLLNSFLIVYILIGLYFTLSFVNKLYQLFSSKLIIGESINEMKLFYHNKNNGIYSFFNRLYLPIKYNSTNLEASIKDHEFAHFKQLHSIDNILIELMSIFFWFNPIIWILRIEIRNNHEFLADQFALKNTNSFNYLQLIISQSKTNHPLTLGSNFSYLSIKNRFKMIQKNKKNPVARMLNISIVIVISISFISLFSFKASDIESNINSQLINTINVDLLERPTGIPIEVTKIKKISAGYGIRVNPILKEEKLHTGVDLIADEGTNILSVGKGTVIKVVYSDKGYGNHLVIQHNSKYSTSYAHLKSINVKKGDIVELNSVIGIIGNSGTSINTHLHFELIENGVKIDPELNMGS